MITLENYFEKMSRVEGAIPPPNVKENAVDLLRRVNGLLQAVYSLTKIEAANDQIVASGWRTPNYNSGVPNAAKTSKHMSGQAIDIRDLEGELDDFLFSSEGRTLLMQYELFMEHPLATKGWCHLQSIPPRSGNIVFIP